MAVLIWEIILMKTVKDTFSSSSTVFKRVVSKLSCSLGYNIGNIASILAKELSEQLTLARNFFPANDKIAASYQTNISSEALHQTLQKHYIKRYKSITSNIKQQKWTLINY